MSRHDSLAKLGATGAGGVHRLALSREDSIARRAVLDWGRDRGFSCSIDPIGNLFIRRSGKDASLPATATGSHLDTQAPGGNFDGIFGVLAGLEVLETLEDNKIDTARPIDLVIWNNEEGVRFSPTTMGSGVYSGAIPLDVALASRDRNGVSVREALIESRGLLGELGRRDLGAPLYAYVEAHIEQGPVLEVENVTIGVVTGIQGIRQFQISIRGEAAHAGTTPMTHRKDALMTAVSHIAKMSDIARCTDEKLRFTVGRLVVSPGASNTVPAEVIFTVDVRHPSEATLQSFCAKLDAIVGGDGGGCVSSLAELLNSPPVEFAVELRDLIRQSASAREMAFRELPSGATHDAKYMSMLCPTSMIFIPCKNGVSHNEAEWASPIDMECGANVLLDSILTLSDPLGVFDESLRT